MNAICVPSLASLICTFCLLVSCGVSYAQSPQQLGGAGDAEIVARIRSNGLKREGRFTLIRADQEAMTLREAEEFGRLLDQTAEDIRNLLRSRFGVEPKLAFPIEVFVTRDPVLSHVSYSDKERPLVFLRGQFVKGRVAPYDHELVHALSGTEEKSQWLVESWANYVASLLPKRKGGYESPLFLNPRNRWVDSWTKTLLRRDANRERLDQVFAKEWPLSSLRTDEDRLLFRSFSYAASHSFTKFLAESVGPKAMGAIYLRKDTDAAILSETGKSLDLWRLEWMQHLDRASERLALPANRIGDYVGRFTGVAPLGSIEVSRSGNLLYSQKPGELRYEMVWMGKDCFRTRMGFVELRFVGGPKGRASAVKYRHFDGTTVDGSRSDEASTGKYCGRLKPRL